MICLDTSIVIDHLRGSDEAFRAVDSALANGERLTASVLTKTELLWAARSDERAAIRRFFELVDWVVVSNAIAEQAGTYARRFRASHHTIDVVDYVIAATATEHSATLWTRNVRHFPMFDGLAAPY